MKGWTGNILRVNLSHKTFRKETYGEDFATKWVGGRGFALKILWDELKPGIDPLGPENKLIVALGPLAGIPAPNTGKTVVAAKSPLTGGYGDGNLGSRMTEQLRKAGYDVLIVEGVAEKPTYLYIEDDKVEFLSASEVWGKGTYETNDWFYKKYGRGVGLLTIGPGGENKVLYAMVRSMEGRAGGRPGIGAVMGSKNLKAIVARGTKEIPAADPEGIREVGLGDLKKVGELDKRTGWSKQGTTGVLSWCNEVAALPVHNMRKTSHPDAWKIDGERLNAARIATYGCPNCTMRCGIAIRDHEGHEAEMDYENIGMLGADLEIFQLDQVGSLNYLCDDLGLDAISSGAVLAFYADAIEHGVIEGDFHFGDAEKAKELLKLIARREGVGDLLAQGTMRMAQKIGKGSSDYAMHVKGLEISAYNCKFIPGMALAYGTSPIGAHHKDSWVITFEIMHSSRESYGREKAEKVIELQRIRGGLFEYLPACRFPWVELGWGLEHYPVYFNRITGLNWTLEDFWKISDRIYALMRFFWVREFPDCWDRTWDYPPRAWFDPSNADKEGIIAGKVLELDKYNQLLDHYYDIRGWDKRGIPTGKTAKDLDLEEEALEVEKFIKLE
jgi:aldehyde:ferredoxin oxidoreductase